MNYEEGNKLIAAFMGKKVYQHVHESNYHISWNELMPVIKDVCKKNDSIGHHIFNDELVDYAHAIEDAAWNNDIEQAYVNVLLLVKWYNEHKENESEQRSKK